MKKRIIKKYKLREGTKAAIMLVITFIVILTYLFYAADRIERIENTGDTKQKSVNIQIKK